MLAANRAYHRLLVDGAPSEYINSDGHLVHDTARLVDFENAEANDWLAVDQFTVIENGHNRRADVVLFLNGLPVAVVELKDPKNEKASIWTAWAQLQTDKQQIPSLFQTNEVLVISDGLTARFGPLTASKEWFLPWRTIDGLEQAPKSQPELEVLVKSLFVRGRFLKYLRHFVLFEEVGGDALTKKLAGYHQFHAVNMAVEQTLRPPREYSQRTQRRSPLLRRLSAQRVDNRRT